MACREVYWIFRLFVREMENYYQCSCFCRRIVVTLSECSDDLLLWFPFDDHFNDVSCHKAIADGCGHGSMTLVDDPGHGQVAKFDGNACLEVCTRAER